MKKPLEEVFIQSAIIKKGKDPQIKNSLAFNRS